MADNDPIEQYLRNRKTRPTAEGMRQPDAPLPKPVDLEQAEVDLREAAYDNARMSQGVPDALRTADRTVDTLRPEPEPISADVTLTEQGLRSLLPKVTTQDNRPMSWAEERDARLKALGQNVARGALFALGPLAEPVAQYIAPGMNRQTAREVVGLDGEEPQPPAPEGDDDYALEPEPVDRGDERKPDRYLGLEAENQVLYLMRVLGSAAPAVLTETAERIPVMGPLEWVTGAETASELLLGVKPGTLQRVDRSREGFVRDWAQGVLERIEDGRGLEEDFAASARARPGQWKALTLSPLMSDSEAETAAWRIGFAMDMMTNWERPFTAAVGKLAGAVRRGVDASKVVGPLPTAEKVEAVVRSAMDPRYPIDELLADRLAAEFERTGDPTVIPDPIRDQVERVAQNERGMTLEEVMLAEGYERDLSGPADSAWEEARRALEDAKRRAGEAAARRGAASEGRLDEKAAVAEGKDIEGEAAKEVHADAQAKAKAALQAQIEIRKKAIEAQRAAKKAAAKVSTTESRGRTLIRPEEREKMIDVAADEAAAKAEPPTGTPGEDPGVFAARQKRATFNRPKDERPVLPEFARPTETATDFWQEATVVQKRRDLAAAPKGYKIPPHLGYERLTKTSGPQSLEDELYVLRDHKGDVKATGKFVDVADTMMGRQLDGDTVSYADKRPVLSWGQQRGGTRAKLSADYVFSSPAESAAVAAMLRENPSAIPTKLRGLEKEKAFRKIERAKAAVKTAQKRLAAQEARIAAAKDAQAAADRAVEAVKREADAARDARELAEAQAKMAGALSSAAAARKRGAAIELEHRRAKLELRKVEAQAKVDSMPEATPSTIGRLLVERLTGAPPKATPQSATVQDLIRKGAKLWMVETVGSSDLRLLPNGVLVPALERDRILKHTDAQLEQAGIGRDRFRQVLTGKPLDPDEVATVRKLAEQLDVPVSATPTAAEVRDLRNAIYNEEAGILADTRYRIRKQPLFVDRLLDAIGSWHLDRSGKQWARKTRAGQLLGLGADTLGLATNWFFDDRLRFVDPHVRPILERGRAQLERNVEDLASEIAEEIDNARKANRDQWFWRWRGVETAPILDRLSKRYAPVLREELDFASEAFDLVLGERKATPEELVELRDRAPLAAGATRELWRDSDDPAILRDGLYSWARTLQDRAVDEGSRWVLAHVAAATQDRPSDMHRALLDFKVTREELLAAYAERANGQANGPATLQALKKLEASPPDNPRDVLMNVLLDDRRRHTLQMMVDELSQAGAVVRTKDVRAKGVLPAVAAGTHRSKGADGRWVYRYPRSSVVWAENRLRDWGVLPGSQAKFEELNLGGQAVYIPTYLKQEIDEVLNAGAAGVADGGRRKTTAKGAYNTGMRAFKTMNLGGFLIPNPAYYVGQALGLMPTMGTTVGPGQTVSTLSRWTTDAPLLSGLMQRLWSPEAYAARGGPSSRWIETRTGEFYHLDEFAAAAREAGLADSAYAYETGGGLVEMLDRAERPINILAPPEWWQGVLNKFGGAADQAAKVAYMVDQVVDGVPLRDAALAARGVALDFRRITDFEQNYMRNVFTFYAFLRKNADAYVRALFTDPGRVMGQMRLAHAGLTDGGMTEEQLGAMDERDTGRWTLYETGGGTPVFNDQGRVHDTVRFTRLQSTPLGVGEWINQVRQLTGQDVEGAFGQLSPAITLPYMLLTNASLGSDRDPASPRAVTIPPYLLDWMPATVEDMFGIGPRPLDLEREDALIATTDIGGRPAVWAAGHSPSAQDEATRSKQRRRWRALMSLVGRTYGSGGTIEQARRGLGLDEARPYATRQLEAISALTGLRIGTVPQPEVARTQLQSEVARPMQETTEALKKGTE